MNRTHKILIRFYTVCLAVILVSGKAFSSDKYTELPAQLTNYNPRSEVHISTPAEAETVRRRVIEFLWPKNGLPIDKLPTISDVFDGKGDLPPELIGVTTALVHRVQRSDINVDFDHHHISYLIEPANVSKSKHLAIVHQGHQGGLKDGISAIVNHVLKQKFTVLLMQMPLVDWNKCNTFNTPSGTVTIKERSCGGHNQMVAKLEGIGGSSLRFFIEPVVVGINYFIKQCPDHEMITMIGLSGGGWTTHIAAAIEPRITLSIPVAGSYPLYLRPYYPGSTGDEEQIMRPLYEDRASWLDIYILGGYGKGRKQIQILNQYDSCCFYGIGSDNYKEIVSGAVRDLGQGQWQCVLDSTHRTHQISGWALETIIAKALSGQ